MGTGLSSKVLVWLPPGVSRFGDDTFGVAAAALSAFFFGAIAALPARPRQHQVGDKAELAAARDRAGRERQQARARGASKRSQGSGSRERALKWLSRTVKACSDERCAGARGGVHQYIRNWHFASTFRKFASQVGAPTLQASHVRQHFANTLREVI